VTPKKDETISLDRTPFHFICFLLGFELLICDAEKGCDSALCCVADATVVATESCSGYDCSKTDIPDVGTYCEYVFC
jgi:hypothetical protein